MMPTITLKQGDCLELMKELPDESVDYPALETCSFVVAVHVIPFS